MMSDKAYPSKKKSCNACQLFDKVDLHTYAQFDQNLPCGSIVMSIFTNCLRTDAQTGSHNDYSAYQQVVQYDALLFVNSLIVNRLYEPWHVISNNVSFWQV